MSLAETHLVYKFILCQIYYIITIDGREVHRVENTDPRMFQDVKVFASDNFHPAADVQYKNLVWKNFNPDKIQKGLYFVYY